MEEPASSSFLCAIPIVCYPTSFDDGVAEAVPRLLADVGMDQPSPQHAFAPESCLLKHPYRDRILNVAHSPHAIDVRLDQRPCGDSLDGLRYVSLVLVRPGEHVSKIGPMATDSHLDHTNRVVIPRESDHPGERVSSNPPRLAAFKKGIRLLNRCGRAPGQIVGNLRVLVVSFEDGGCVFPSGPTQNELSVCMTSGG